MRIQDLKIENSPRPPKIRLFKFPKEIQSYLSFGVAQNAHCLMCLLETCLELEVEIRPHMANIL